MSKVQVSPKSDKNEMIWTTIYPETKFLSNCEPAKPNKICAFKYDSGRTDILIPKERNRKEGRGDRSQANPRSSKANSKKSSGLRIILFGSMLYPPGSLGWQCHPQGYVRSSGSTLGPGGGCGAGGGGGDAQDVAFFGGKWSCPLKQVETALPLPFPSRPLACALWACCESGSPEDLWVAFGALLPFSGKMAHIYSQIALWSHLIESKKSFVHSLPLSLSPLVQTNDGIIPSLFPDLCWHGWLSLRIAPMISLWAFVFSLEQTYFFAI